MPRISDKGQHMPASPIRKLVPYATSAKARGTEVLHLNIGQPDLQTPKVFWDNLRAIEDGILAYSDSDGYTDYKEKWVQYYATFGANITSDDLIITTGASEALSIAKLACLDPGDEIIIPEPLYANYIGFAKMAGINIKPISTSIDDGFCLPPISAFNESIGPRTKAILICNPNNPTGYLYTREELETLRDIVIRHDLFLFVDEVYREFAYDGKEHISILTMEGLENNVIVFDSISKRFSACGARIGALISRNKQVIDTAMKFAQARLSPPSLSQLAGKSLFDLKQSYYDAIIEEYDERRKFLVEKMQAIDGVKCPMPGGAFYAMLELPVDNSDRFCQWLLEEFEHEGKTVMLAPGSGFYSTPGLGTKEARMAYVLNKEKLEQAVSILRRALASYPGRTKTSESQMMRS
ncbi:MAG: aspartate aminotransferase [Limisphaerales bacterium]|jgi:aspartate aminotransferase